MRSGWSSRSRHGDGQLPASWCGHSADGQRSIAIPDPDFDADHGDATAATQRPANWAMNAFGGTPCNNRWDLHAAAADVALSSCRTVGSRRCCGTTAWSANEIHWCRGPRFRCRRLKTTTHLRWSAFNVAPTPCRCVVRNWPGQRRRPGNHNSAVRSQVAAMLAA